MKIKSLVKAVERFVDIDDKIHSRPDNVPWSQVERDAEVYTEARRELLLLIKRIRNERNV